MGIENIRAISLEGFIAKVSFFVLALQFRMFLMSKLEIRVYYNYNDDL